MEIVIDLGDGEKLTVRGKMAKELMKISRETGKPLEELVREAAELMILLVKNDYLSIVKCAMREGRKLEVATVIREDGTVRRELVLGPRL